MRGMQQSPNPKRILFDHLPKCGGTTVTTYLSDNFPHRLIYSIYGPDPFKAVEEFKGLPRGLRFVFRLIQGHSAHGLLDHVDPETIFTTVFREPIDRIISHYFFVKRTKYHYLYDKVRNNNIQLEDYCSSGISVELRNWYVTYFTGLKIEEAESNPQRSVDLAFRVITEKYHLIGFQDGIPAFMDELRIMAELRKPFINEYKNKTSEREMGDDVTQIARDRIAQINSLDIMLFDRLLSTKQKGVIRNHILS